MATSASVNTRSAGSGCIGNARAIVKGSTGASARSRWTFAVVEHADAEKFAAQAEYFARRAKLVEENCEIASSIVCPEAADRTT
jgi:hypothetical protein